MVNIDGDYLLDILRQSIRINSIIPSEQALAEFFAEKIRELGLEPEWHQVAPGRPNVYCSAQLGAGKRFLTLTGHLDTVDVAMNWPTDPFEPVEKEGRLYGLGAWDMKSGLACAMAAFKALIEAETLHGRLGRLGLALTVDEEGYGLGAKALLQTEYGQSDGFILGEPFYGGSQDRALPLGMTGKVLYKLTVQGKMAHAFRPENGINAVEDAGRILAALERLNIGAHPQFGSGNYSTLKVEGGYQEYAVVVPERCELIISRLTVAGESRESAVADMRALVDRLDLASTVTIETPPPYYEPYLIEQDGELVAAFSAAHELVQGAAPLFGVSRGITDANIYVPEGKIATLTFGPGGAGAHEAGEYVEMATLEPVARVYTETAIRFLSQ
jgi:acetylornithine deacetylase/succinyl-diaminopimelate desuccinylase-like protein